MDYELETDRVIKEIKKTKVKKVCLQFPDGIKMHADRIYDEITSKTDAQVIIWMGSNFGACDLATQAKEIGVDLLVHYGHSEWKY